MKNNLADVAKYYLGTGLKVRQMSDHNSPIRDTTMAGVYEYGLILNGVSAFQWEFRKCMPIMHPLSKLTEEITVEGYNDGNPFVPIEKLKLGRGEFEIKLAPSGSIHNTTPFWVLKRLIDWHFNVFNVKCIEK